MLRDEYGMLAMGVSRPSLRASAGASLRPPKLLGVSADGCDAAQVDQRTVPVTVKLKLVDAALLGPSPRILLNDYTTVTQKNEQRGVAALARGLFSAVRNPQAHEPRSMWSMTEQDALDILATLSLVHRRLSYGTLGLAQPG